MKSGRSKIIIAVILLGIIAGLSVFFFKQFRDKTESGEKDKAVQPQPVEVAQIQRGPIVLRRTFSGTLEALSEFVVSPKVSGRVEKLFVNLSDTVKRGQLIAELDNDEYVQTVAQAKADLLVAKANLARAKSNLDISNREFARTESLLERGIASGSEFDSARADQMSKQAELEVAEAQVIKANSSLKTANIRLGYTKVTAGWTGGNEYRIVAERYLDEGQTVAANAQLLLIVELDPIIGVVFVSEKDYARLKPGQIISLTTDAYPGEEFLGKIDRIAPVFKKSTRQARVEMIIENPRHRLKPGMFIRATVVLERVQETTIISQQAITTRDDKTGVFIVSKDGKSVAWYEVKTGIIEGDRVQVEGEELSGRVVTLGQQLIKDGSAIIVGSNQHKSVSGPKESDLK
ncbi:MAG: efflux RND transporter periplasmic adaptor subunit [Proteobacteria bacterium]|nr:efflux RND transporter periplasmic adaptor subunit [Pseudomonadota bacterium]